MKILKIRLRVAYLRKDKAKVTEGAYGKNFNPQNKRSITNLDEDVHLPRFSTRFKQKRQLLAHINGIQRVLHYTDNMYL